MLHATFPQAVCALGLRCIVDVEFSKRVAAKIEKFPRLHPLFFNRHSSFLRKLSAIPLTYTYLGFYCEEQQSIFLITI